MKIYLVRHGQTKSNKEGRFVGWNDVDLSSEGCRQAEKVAQRFSTEPVAALYSSELIRARRTAEIIGKKHGLEPQTSTLLREINFGAWEGLTHGEIMSLYGPEMRRWINNPFRYSPPGGESLRQVYSRMEQFLASLSPCEYNDGAIVLVSHGGAIISVLHHIMGLSENEIWDRSIKNASVSLLQKNNSQFEVVFINDISHITD